jgi:hypothetical protein
MPPDVFMIDKISLLTIVWDQLIASIFFLSNKVLRFIYVGQHELWFKNNICSKIVVIFQVIKEQKKVNTWYLPNHASFQYWYYQKDTAEFQWQASQIFQALQ